MSLAAALESLQSTDVAPTIQALGGEKRFVRELRELPEHLVGRAAEVLWASWDTVGDRTSALRVLLDRAIDVASDVEFADIGDAAVAAAWTDGSSSVEVVGSALLRVMDADGIETHPLRAGHAVRQLAVVAARNDTPIRVRLLARIADIEDVPAPAASSFVRAYGQLNDIEETPWLEAKITALAQHPDAASQAAVELALGQMRRGFLSDNEESALLHLATAAKLFRSAAEADEHREDAVGLEAVVECVLAFAERDAVQMQVWAEVAERAGLELAAGRWNSDQSAVETKVGAWVILLSELREVRRGLDSTSVLHVERAVRAMARAYSGLRLVALNDERFGLRAIVVPQVVSALADSDNKRQAMQELAGEAGNPDSAHGAAMLLDEVSIDPKVRAARRRRHRRYRDLSEPTQLRLILSATS